MYISTLAVPEMIERYSGVSAWSEVFALAVLIITYILDFSSPKCGYANMLNSARVYNTLRGNVLYRDGNNGFFNGFHPEIDMIAVIIRRQFQIVWHNKDRAACELYCALYVEAVYILSKSCPKQ